MFARGENSPQLLTKAKEKAKAVGRGRLHCQVRPIAASSELSSVVFAQSFAHFAVIATELSHVFQTAALNCKFDCGKTRKNLLFSLLVQIYSERALNSVCVKNAESMTSHSTLIVRLISLCSKDGINRPVSHQYFT